MYLPKSLIAFSLLIPVLSFAMTVQQAYDDIPHKRTVFQAAQGTMSSEEGAALNAFFEAVDLAIIAKAEVKHGMAVEKAYEPFWKTWKSLSWPKKLDTVRSSVELAVKEQQSYLAKKSITFDRNNPQVQKASGALHQAYGLLMQLYPNENAMNKQAFFDYLCALDFI